MNLISILAGPLMEVIGKAIPDASKRQELEAELTKVLASSNDKALEAMSNTMAADASSDGILTRNVRPLVVLWSLGMVSYLVVSPSSAVLDAMRAVPDQLWNLIAVGIGGYTLARTTEKVAATIVKGMRR